MPKRKVPSPPDDTLRDEPPEFSQSLLSSLDAIANFFENSPGRVFRFSDLQEIWSSGGEDSWSLDRSVTLTEFVDCLLRKTPLRKLTFPFPSRTETRYLWGDVPLLDIVLSLRPEGYLSHFTAMSFHGLTDQVSRTIYLNQEQRRHPGQSRHLTQEAIDRAFRGKVRISKEIAIHGDFRVCLLSSMGVDRAGVIEATVETGSRLRVTDLERTLIDITVRPVYSGGVTEVLEAFRRARENVSINRLRSLLKTLDFVYPYHQAIGFYMERAGGYSESQLGLMRELGFEFDFYLTHQMRDPAHSERWRLFHPQGF